VRVSGQVLRPIRERWEQGIELPGVERFKAIDLSVNALKK